MGLPDQEWYDYDMKKTAIRQCELKHVKIRPIAKHLAGGKGGAELPAVDYDWLVGRITNEGVPISTPTGHGITLKSDHIHQFTSDPIRGDMYGTLVLTVQVYFGGSDVWIEPVIGRPGSN